VAKTLVLSYFNKSILETPLSVSRRECNGGH
jgi:hypothetical protein